MNGSNPYGRSIDEWTAKELPMRFAQRASPSPGRPSGNWSLPTSRTARHRGRFVYIGRPLLGCPEGTSESSPAFQRWVGRQKVASPEGTAEVQSHSHSSVVPSGLVCRAGCFPALKRRAILKMSLRDNGTWRLSSASSRRLLLF